MRCRVSRVGRRCRTARGGEYTMRTRSPAVRDYAATVLGFLAVVIVVFAAGLSVSERLWRNETAGPCERFFSGTICGVALWMAATWLLALAHALTRATLIGVTVALALAAMALRPRLALPRPSWLLLPVALWTIYALWKGFVLPPLSHDVLAYHLPRAVMLMRAHGWGHFYAADPRITGLPANYELLLADVLAMAGPDRLTEWLGTLSFLLFLGGTAAFAERWWPSPRRAAAVLTVAGAPVLLLHSSADKNDVMTCAFAAAALLWGARWSSRGGRTPMLLLIVSLALTAGTKPSAGAIAIGLAPFFLPRLRSLRIRDVAATAVAAALALALLGGVAYIHDAPHGGGGGAAATTGIAWGDFANLGRVPLLMLSVPFTQDLNSVWVPWRHEAWYWPHYEIFFSHYGSLFTFLVPLLPLCVVRYRRAGDDAMRRERRNASLAAAIALAVILPLRTFPLGLLAATPPRPASRRRSRWRLSCRCAPSRSASSRRCRATSRSFCRSSSAGRCRRSSTRPRAARACSPRRSSPSSRSRSPPPRSTAPRTTPSRRSTTRSGPHGIPARARFISRTRAPRSSSTRWPGRATRSPSTAASTPGSIRRTARSSRATWSSCSSRPRPRRFHPPRRG